MFEWECVQITRLESQRGAYMTKCVRELGHTIDRMGRRVVFCIQNNRKVMRYFDTSRQAVEEARKSQFQPVKLYVITIEHKGMYWSIPLKDLVELIEKEGRYL